MLDFTSEENLLMLEILELNPSHFSYLQDKQQNAYDILGSAFLSRTRTILEEYTTLDENDAASGAEQKTGLKKADVLEWFSPNESGNKLSENRLSKLRTKLSNLLNISQNISYPGYNLTPMYKG